MNQIKQKTSGFNIYDEIPLTELVPFKNHPFKVKDDAEMDALKKSIEESGVLVPAVARYNPHGDGYELIAGHRRFAACRALGFEKMPVIVFDGLTDEEAVIMMVDSNLQREHVLPSEKAFAYKMKMDAMKHQGHTCGQVGHKSREEISETESGRTVQRYIRLTYLIPELLDWMDEGRMAFSVGVELSFLDKQAQYDVVDICEQHDCTPSYSQSWHLHKAMTDGTLDRELIAKTLSTEKPNQRETLKIPMDKLRDRLPKNLSVKEQEDFVLKAVDHYKKYLVRSRDRER